MVVNRDYEDVARTFVENPRPGNEETETEPKFITDNEGNVLRVKHDWLPRIVENAVSFDD